MTTNIAELVNAVILPARRLPITAAHECLRGLVQRWFCARLDGANKLQSSLTSAAVARVNKMSKIIQKSVVYPIRDSVKYHVKNTDDRDGIVNVEQRTCTCKQ